LPWVFHFLFLAGRASLEVDSHPRNHKWHGCLCWLLSGTNSQSTNALALERTSPPECLGELRLHIIWEHISHLCQRGRGGLFIIENGVCQPWTGFEPRDVDRLLHFTADHHFCWSRLYASHVRMAVEITSNCRRAASIKEGTITSEVGIFYGKHISSASSHQSLSERYPNAVYATRYLPQQPWKEG
jgi:hypothetical protein